ncbi:hypothetical protein EVG20_g11485 [Dentipellis fragilis]|uniref:Uncharacterized protein n=1 Tax=Dentipellis fragilis TaxID=205917 RepID=A0A4Y9XLA8_9AGAM|nr:hypothetical protein EVG20_g11485 [Dentipellis fragilis]
MPQKTHANHARAQNLAKRHPASLHAAPTAADVAQPASVPNPEGNTPAELPADSDSDSRMDGEMEGWFIGDQEQDDEEDMNEGTLAQFTETLQRGLEKAIEEDRRARELGKKRRGTHYTGCSQQTKERRQRQKREEANNDRVHGRTQSSLHQ